MNNWFEIIPLPNQIYAICEPNHEEDVKSFLIIGSQKALLFDTGMGIENIKEEVEKLWKGDLIVLNSHFHFDHVGDNWRFPHVYGIEDHYADSIAQNGCEMLKIKPYSRKTIKDGHVFDLGNRRLEVISAPGHCDDCIMLLDLDYRVLFCGDGFYEGPLFIQMDDETFGKSSLEKYYLSIEKILNRFDQYDIVYSSHNDFMVNKIRLKSLYEALSKIRRGLEHGERVPGEVYNYYKTPQNLVKFRFDGFSIIADNDKLEIHQRVKHGLHDGGYTCYICAEDEIYTSRVRGVKPLLGWLDQKIDLTGAIAADKVVGKAAAMLYVLLKVGYVYASVISKPALDIFEKYGIEVAYDTLVDAIENRTKTGFCPMERAVWDLEEPEEAPAVLKNALLKLAQESVKELHICQIEDKRAEIAALQRNTESDDEREELQTQMESLDEEKKRRGYR